MLAACSMTEAQPAWSSRVSAASAPALLQGNEVDAGHGGVPSAWWLPLISLLNHYQGLSWFRLRACPTLRIEPDHRDHRAATPRLEAGVLGLRQAGAGL
jgi:hypothetical protein